MAQHSAEGTQADIDRARDRVAECERVIRAVLDQKQRELLGDRYRPEFQSQRWDIRWDLVRLFDKCIAGKQFPPERASRFIDYMIDVKLELYYLMEVFGGLSNEHVYFRGFDEKRPLEQPRLLLIKLALDQSEIGANRVLWERIMNAVYYLDTGTELEDKVTNRKSKKAVFFKRVSEVDAWKPLGSAEKLLEWYDNSFRTPEYHKSSVLRSALLGRALIDDSELLDPVNMVLNGVWETIAAAIDGDRPPFSLGGSPRWLDPLPVVMPDGSQ